MATVIGIFENQYINKKPLTIVKPGNQTRKFTHILDTIEVCIDAWKKNKCRHYSISAKENYSILEIAKMFNRPFKFIPKRLGERYASSLTKMYLTNQIINKIGKRSIKKYILEFKKNND